MSAEQTAVTAEEEPLESNEPAPATFVQCIQQAAKAANKAIQDGYKLVEVEFPPLSVDFMEDTSSSAYDISRANVRLASQFGEFFSIEGKRVSVLLPDEPELERAVEDEGTDELFPRVKLTTARSNIKGTAQSLDQIFSGFFGGKSGEVVPIPNTDMYVAIIFSCQELPDLRKLHEADPEKPIVFFNLKLDSQRGDLGLPAFPPKSLHYEFLSQIKPVYLLRTRAYSKSLARPPYLVNYQGAQFRVYPGAYQSLLDIGSARYKQVGKTKFRPALGAFKDTLTSALQLDDGEGQVASFFRKGYKTCTWWEDEKAFPLELSDNWRT
ncbi:hypothetical protein JKP88DRAFT_163085 [Tribonema minus]|uniref:DUF1995 domain-containing protein n=1 Tax=Tribonema minus TaxID=303371 RepID=A0A836CH17_9STRA|nr:hypothetical protein JKP88DRAFT_163085 [Tribonema minus]